MSQIVPLGQPQRERSEVGTADRDRRAAELTDLFRREGSGYVRLVYLLTGDRHAAEDLVQDCFARVFAQDKDLHDSEVYLRVAVMNASRSWGTRRKLEAHRRPAVATLVPPAEMVEFRDALLALTERQRTAVVGRYYADLDDQRLAQILDCRPATVRSLIARGLKELRKVIPHAR